MGIYIFISVIIIVVCVIQVLIVLVQNSKGGGLAANLTSTGGQSMGIRKTADFLEKSTWTIAISIFVLSLLATAAIPRGEEGQRSRIESQIQNAIDPNAIPTLPSPLPSNDNQGQPQPPL